MYHIGKIVEILKSSDKDVVASDNEVQALVEMWDDNIMTIGVVDSLKDKIKVKDTVLVDYSPISEKVVIPKQIITKIVRGEKAEKIWKIYKDFFLKGKGMTPKEDNKYFG